MQLAPPEWMKKWLKSYQKLKGALEVFDPTLTLEKEKKNDLEKL